MMIDILLALGIALNAILWLLEIRRSNRNNKDLHRVAKLTNAALKAQREINEAQYSMNSGIAQNLEILGVHTRLIKPSVAMQAEAFLQWHNRKDEEEENG